MVFGLILFAFAVICALMLFAFAARVNKYVFFKDKGKKGILLSWLVPLFLALVICVIGGFTNALVIFMHLLAFLGICCFIGFVFKKIKNKEINHKYIDITAVLITVVYLFSGWINMINISRIDYALETSKNIGKDFRVVLVTDFHLSMTLDGDDVGKLVDRINGENSDIVVISGDLVDDETAKEDMLESCKAFGKLKSKYGVYFVFGNHDEGYFQYRNFNGTELRNALENNGVMVLEDETAVINEKIFIVGRKDASDKDRKSISDLTKNISKDAYTIVLDHQPNDFDNQAKAGVDLVLSGHTHGGHMFPAGPIGVLIGANDEYYGLHTRNKTDFIISSGVSGWEIPFKTGTRSEYVVIDVKCNSEAK